MTERPVTIFPIRCLQGGHLLVRVDEFRGRRHIVVRYDVPELGPHSSILEAGKHSWGPYGDLDEEADDPHGSSFAATCDCPGVVNLSAVWIRDRLNESIKANVPKRDRKAVVEVNLRDADDVPIGYTSTLSTHHLSREEQ